ncbi:MAG: T9SS type A sorting domain-containing protein [Flavobacteriales bacterium]
MKKLISSIATVLLFSNLSAQDYYFQTVQESYSDLSSATVLSTGIVWDDEEMFPIAMPFTFVANGNTIDSIYATSNGIISMNYATYTDGDPIMQLYFTEADQVDMGSLNSGMPESPISYSTGVADGKEFITIEFKNAAFYEDSSTSDFDFINVQVTLLDDNSIHIHYGPSQVSFPETYFENEMGDVIGFLPDYEMNDTTTTLNADAYVLSGNPLSPSVINIPPAPGTTEEPGLDAHPANGTKYVFATDSVPLNITDFNQESIEIINPIVDEIQFTKGEELIKSLEIFNSNGQKMLLTHSSKYDVSKLSSGLYLLKISDTNGNSFTQKVIKQ